MKKNVIIFVSALLAIILIVGMILLFTTKSSFYVTLKTGNEGGSITSEQGLATSVEKGKDLRVYICPNEGYEVEKVLVDNKEVNLEELVYEKDNPNAASEDGVAVYILKSVSKDQTIEAYFKEKTTLHIALKVGNEGGTITSERGLATYMEKGESLKVYLCPNEGYEIEKVLVDNNEVDIKTLVYEKDNPNAASEDGVAVYSFENISSNHTIEVYFKTK